LEEQLEKLSLDVVTPTAHLVFEQVDEISIPGAEGDFDVMFDHTPFLTSLRPGVLSYKIGEEMSYFAVSAGFAEVIPDRVIILAEMAESADAISEQRAKDARDRAKKRLDRAGKGFGEIDIRRAEVALLRATARLNVLSLASGNR